MIGELFFAVQYQKIVADSAPDAPTPTNQITSKVSHACLSRYEDRLRLSLALLFSHGA
jgi:hypothetical protein